MSARRQILRKVQSLIVVSFGGLGTFAAFNIRNENEKFYQEVFMPVVQKLDPEMSHNLAVKALKYGLFPNSKYKDSETMATTVFGINFSNSVGVAAGLDKQGEAVDGLHGLGFGFVEVGSVTPEPQSGQDKPRLFRLPENKALVNRMGFNSDGHDAVHKRLVTLRATPEGSKLRIGVNLGKNKTSTDAISDYSKGILLFSDVADYLVVNVSSPNTAGLRELQEQNQLRKLLSSLVKLRDSLPMELRRPLLLKLSPDLTESQRNEIAAVIMEPSCRVDGLVVSNTSVSRPVGLLGPHNQEVGGLSGPPIIQASTKLIADMYRLTKGKLPIIGVGGVSSGKDAYEKILAGASLVQLYTAFTYHGPPLISKVKRELEKNLQENGWSNIAEAVGKGSCKN